MSKAERGSIEKKELYLTANGRKGMKSSPVKLFNGCGSDCFDMISGPQHLFHSVGVKLSND